MTSVGQRHGLILITKWTATPVVPAATPAFPHETDARDIRIATLEAELRAQRDLIARLDQDKRDLQSERDKWPDKRDS